MTRFARTKGQSGSGSNPRRVEEDATPWHLMAQAMRSQNKSKENFEVEEEVEAEQYESNIIDAKSIDNDIALMRAESEEEAVGTPLLQDQKENADEHNGVELKAKTKKPSRRERTKDKCLFCKSKGHLKKDCPQLSEERRKELQDLYEMKVTRKGQGTGRKKNKKRKATDANMCDEVQDDEIHTKKKKTITEKLPSSQNIMRDKTGQVVGKNEGLFQGFRVRLDDVSRLRRLEKTLKSDPSVGLSEIDDKLKRERRKAERELAKYNKMVCYNCRQSGHLLADCPNANADKKELESRSCFKCGSQDHTSRTCEAKVKTGADSYAFATCFICKEVGHLAKACPDNPKGLYPKGGGCRFCGSVEHLKADCPRKLQKDSKLEVKIKAIDSGRLEDIEDEDDYRRKKQRHQKDKRKVVSF